MGTAPQAELRVRVGIDVVDVERFERLVGDDPDLAERLFTQREIAYCLRKRRSGEHLAARFAAKEAVLKAFGTGVSQRMRWTEVEVVNEPSGRPCAVLEGAVLAFGERNGLRQLDISLAHTEGLAVAHAVTLWEGRGACAST